MDPRLQRIKELIELKERTDAELESLIAGETFKQAKQRVCKNCGQPGHASKGCPQKVLPLQE
jgi:hypothetical protein